MTDKTMPDESSSHADAGTARNNRDEPDRGSGAPATQAASPLISAIEIKNFKGIGRPMRIEFRPITLLFGNNSAGKSTVLHALCYAHEILSNRSVDVHKSDLGGDRVDLRGFRNFVHQHDLDREVQLRFELNLDGWDMPAPLRERLGSPMRARSATPLGHEQEMQLSYADPNGTSRQLRGLHGTFVPHNPASEIESRDGWVELRVRWDRSRDKPLVNSYEVGVNGLLVGRLQEGSEDRIELLANLAHPWFGREKDDCTIGAQHAGQLNEGLGSTVDGWQHRRFAVRSSTRSLTSSLPNWRELLYLDTDDASRGTEELEQLDERASIALVGLGMSLRDALSGLRYIGPLRNLYPSGDTERGRSGLGRWADGSAAWDLLEEDAAQHDPRLIPSSADWLSRADRLDTGYALRVRSTVKLPGDELLVARILESKRKHRIPESKTQKETSIEPSRLAPETTDESPGDVVRNAEPAEIEHLADAIAGSPIQRETQLVSTRTSLPVQPSDVGVGISQILPIVVAALDEDRPGITTIEQPELHLHPRIQVELGDLFASQAAKGGIFLIETHSEHLLLRLMKRMRQTCDGTLVNGNPRMRPEDIAVYFVEIDPGGDHTLIREMPLNERGELVEAWPGGFFEEDLREIF